MATNNDDTIFFFGTLGQLTTTLVNAYSGEIIEIVDEEKNVNNLIYDGLGGNDTLFMSSLGDALFIEDNLGNQVVTSIELFLAGDGGDIINLSSTNFSLGDIVILGGAGDDILWSNVGNDTILGGAGNDIIDGGPGNDFVGGESDVDIIKGGAGDDTVDGGSEDDILYGESGFTIPGLPGGPAVIHQFGINNPVSHPAGGDIQHVATRYNVTTNEFHFKLIVTDPPGKTSQGFTLALNNGPNPKGVAGEMALFYFDNSGVAPIVSVYGYNGLNNFSSFKDGDPAAGIQAPDQILTSLAAGHPFTDISALINTNGDHVFQFTMDASTIINHVPLYGDPADWTGMTFEGLVGIWLHPMADLTSAYDGSGFLTGWSSMGHGWYDTINSATQTVFVGGDDPTTGGNDKLIGGAGDDQLFGEGGDDILIGGTGADILNGGIGSDQFVIKQLDGNVDTIADFVSGAGNDILNLTDILSGFNEGVDDLNDFLQFVISGTDTEVQVDTGGSGAAYTTIAVMADIALATGLNDLISDGNLVIDQTVPL